MPTLVYSWHEWADLHGGPDSCVNIGGRLIFPDGAWSSIDTLTRSEPPSDPWQNLYARRAYVAELVRRAEAAFHRTRRGLVHLADLAKQYANYPPPTDADLKALEEQRSRVTELREQLDQLDAELASSPAEVFKRAVLEEEQAKAALANEMQTKIMAIGL